MMVLFNRSLSPHCEKESSSPMLSSLSRLRLRSPRCMFFWGPIADWIVSDIIDTGLMSLVSSTLSLLPLLPLPNPVPTVRPSATLV